MPQAQNSLTPIDAVDEERLVSFDYGNAMQDGITVVSVIEMNCSVVTGSDPTPNMRLLSLPAVVDAAPLPFGTGRADAAVSIMIGDCVAGVTYLLQCVALTTDNQHLSIWQHLDCVLPQ